MIFSYDKFNRIERPILYLTNPYKTYIGTIQNTELKMDLCFNSMSEMTFKTYKYVNGYEMPNYDDIEVLKLIEAQYIAWFQITDCIEHGEGKFKYKEVTARTLENELCKKMLTSFGSMGVSTDEQGGLDRYCLYNVADTDHSILHIVMEKAPLWTVGHIDPEITTEYRSFDEDSIDTYNFLTDNVAKAFECIFVFDTFQRTINAYKLENVGKETSIFLSHRNVIEHAQIKESSDDIYTVMTVSGGDYDGNPLQITDVNPTGTSYICNFDYYYPWFSDELKVKITEFNNACAERKGGYTTAISTLKELMLELEDINNRVPETEHSTDWSEYGVIELQSEFNYYNQKMSVYLDGQNESKRMEYYNILYGTNGIQNALTQRKSEAEAKEYEIAHQQEIIDNYVINMEEFLGNELYKELSSYFYYTTFTDDTFVATRAMDDSEILEMKLALLEEAERKLAEVSHPSYTMTIDSGNFLALPKYKEYAEQLSLGCMVSVEFEEDEIITPRLLRISIDWEDMKNFTLTFSSKTKLDDGLIQLEEVHKQINSTVTSQILSGIGWDAAKNQITPVNEFMNSALDASKNALFSGKNQEVITDGSGMRLRKWVDELNGYSPNQMWETNNGIYLTDSAWESVNVAIGELNIGKDANGNDITMYGIAAPLLLGKMTISESLYIMNQSNSFSINNDGLLALSQNKNTAIKINPNNNSSLIEIVKGYGTSSEKSVFYTDSSGNLNLTGTINANSGTIGGWTIDSNGLSGSGTISGGEITGSSISAGTITGTTINGSNIKSGSIEGAEIVSRSDDGSFVLITGGRLWSKGVFLSMQESGVNVSTTGGLFYNGNRVVLLCNDIACNSINADSHTHSTGNLNASLGASATYAGTYYADFSNTSGDTNIPTIGWVKARQDSDVRLKDILELEDNEAAYLNIEPVAYRFKDGVNNKTVHFGFKAQDLAEMFGVEYDLVEFDKDMTEGERKYCNDGVYRINYENFHALHVQMIQKLSKRIDTLENELAKLKSLLAEKL